MAPSTSPQQRVRVGIVGASPQRGWALGAHLPALAKLPQYEIVAVATSRRETAELAAARYGVARWYDDAAALAEDPHVDLVTVAVKVPHHAEVVRAALAAGRHVYCEWPLARTPEESTALLREVRDAGVHHAVGLQARGSAVLRHLRDKIADGLVGRVQSAVIHAALPFGSSGTVPAASAYSLDPANGASLIRVPGAHTLDAIELILGPIAAVSATTAGEGTVYRIPEEGRSVASAAPTHLLVNAELEGGAAAAFAVHYGQVTNPGLRVEISGTEGDLLLTADGPRSSIQMAELRAFVAHRGSDVVTELPTPAAYHRAANGLLPQPARNVAEAYAQLAADLNAGTHEVPDFAAANRLHQLLDAIERAAATRAHIAPTTLERP